MTRIIDSTRVTMNWDRPFQTRNANQIDAIAVHGTATRDDFTRQMLENGARARGWTNVGYTEMIHRNGDVELLHTPEVVTNGVAGHNVRAYHIALVGNANWTPQQLVSLEARVRHNMQRFNVSVANVLAHREFPGQATACIPALNMDDFRNRLRQLVAPPIPSTGAAHTVRAGETLSSIARQHGITVNAIAQANNIINVNLIRTGQVLTIPSSGTTTPNITAGREIRLNTTPLFVNATTLNQSSRVTGTFWLWSNEVINGRIRITNSRDRVGGNPATNVTGWINISDLN